MNKDDLYKDMYQNMMEVKESKLDKGQSPMKIFNDMKQGMLQKNDRVHQKKVQQINKSQASRFENYEKERDNRLRQKRQEKWVEKDKQFNQ